MDGGAWGKVGEGSMGYINWTDNLDLGLPVMDADHRRMADLLNQFLQSLDGREDGAVPILETLIGAAQAHFQREEALLDQLHYPELPYHRLEHQRLIAQINHFKNRFASGEMPQGNSLAIADWLRRWLFDHILNEDRAYRPFVMRLA